MGRLDEHITTLEARVKPDDGRQSWSGTKARISAVDFMIMFNSDSG